jgi:hypothetical protein
MRKSSQQNNILGSSSTEDTEFAEADEKNGDSLPVKELFRFS